MKIDIFVGAVIFSFAGALVGYYLQHLGIGVTGALLGLVLGNFVARLGARCFFISVLVWTILGAVLGWYAGGMAFVPLMAGSGSAIGGFLGVNIEMFLRRRKDEG